MLIGKIASVFLIQIHMCQESVMKGTTCVDVKWTKKYFKSCALTISTWLPYSCSLLMGYFLPSEVIKRFTQLLFYL